MNPGKREERPLTPQNAWKPLHVWVYGADEQIRTAYLVITKEAPYRTAHTLKRPILLVFLQAQFLENLFWPKSWPKRGWTRMKRDGLSS